jgi:hypothetical protein
MNATDLPSRIAVPFANAAGAGYVRPLPTPSQIGIVDGAASYTDGFPPFDFTPLTAGGIPVDGRDMNGVLLAITQWNRWQAAGGPVFFDATFAAAVGGYPKGAKLDSNVTSGLVWVSAADANASNPDATGATGWQPLGTPLATDTEVIAGLLNTKAATPSGVHAAIEALLPIAATLAQASAGTDAVDFITPLTLAGVLGSAPRLVTQTTTSTTYVRHWSDGTIEQGLTIAPFGPGLFNFSWPTPFASYVSAPTVSISAGLNFTGSESCGYQPYPGLSGGTVWTNNGASTPLGLTLTATGK